MCHWLVFNEYYFSVMMTANDKYDTEFSEEERPARFQISMYAPLSLIFIIASALNGTI